VVLEDQRELVEFDQPQVVDTAVDAGAAVGMVLRNGATSELAGGRCAWS
jgi:hypothetical protein